MEDMLELSARLSAQAMLLEIVYCNAFAKDQVGFDRLMVELQRLTRVAPVLSEPQPDDAVIELQARVATHLQRFHEAVQYRIASARAI